MMRLQAEVDELGVFCVVVVLLGLDARVGNVIDLDGNSNFPCSSFYKMGQIQDRELLCKLVVDPAFVLGSRVVASEFDASHRITNIEEAARLPALAVDGEGLSDGCLDAETIQDGAEDIVVVETIDERFIQRNFVGHGSVND